MSDDDSGICRCPESDVNSTCPVHGPEGRQWVWEEITTMEDAAKKQRRYVKTFPVRLTERSNL